MATAPFLELLTAGALTALILLPLALGVFLLASPFETLRERYLELHYRVRSVQAHYTDTGAGDMALRFVRPAGACCIGLSLLGLYATASVYGLL